MGAPPPHWARRRASRRRAGPPTTSLGARPLLANQRPVHTEPSANVCHMVRQPGPEGTAEVRLVTGVKQPSPRPSGETECGVIFWGKEGRGLSLALRALGSHGGLEAEGHSQAHRPHPTPSAEGRQEPRLCLPVRVSCNLDSQRPVGPTRPSPSGPPHPLIHGLSNARPHSQLPALLRPKATSARAPGGRAGRQCRPRR